MNAYDVRSALRLHRFEIIAGGLLLAVLAAITWWVAWRLDLTGYGARCALLGTDTPDCAARGRAFFDLQQTAVPLLRLALTAVPLLVAPLVGVAVVGRELERGTARLTWSIAPSRAVWFTRRVVPIVVVVLGLGLVAGSGLDRLLGAINPWVDPNHTLTDLGNRGLPFAARAVFVLALAVAIGAVAGRTLPALLVTAVVGAIAISGGTWAHERILRGEAIWVELAGGVPEMTSGDMLLAQRARLPDGRIVEIDEALALYPQPGDGPGQGGFAFPIVDLVVPGSRYPVAAAWETAILGGASLALLVGAALIVRRRRPG